MKIVLPGGSGQVGTVLARAFHRDGHDVTVLARHVLADQPWKVEIGAFLMRSETELILKSRRVIPGRLLDAGFRFVFADWESAARDLCARALGRATGYSA